MSMANLSIIFTSLLDKSTCQMSSHQPKIRLEDQIGLHNDNFIKIRLTS